MSAARIAASLRSDDPVMHLRRLHKDQLCRARQLNHTVSPSAAWQSWVKTVCPAAAVATEALPPNCGFDGLANVVIDPLFGVFEFNPLYPRTQYIYALCVLLLGFLVIRTLSFSPCGSSAPRRSVEEGHKDEIESLIGSKHVGNKREGSSLRKPRFAKAVEEKFHRCLVGNRNVVAPNNPS